MHSPAGYGLRTVAAGLDAVASGIIFVVLLLPLVPLAVLEMMQPVHPIWGWLIAGAAPLAPALVNAVELWRGRSPGKLLTGLIVEDRSGRAARSGALVARWFMKSLPWLIACGAQVARWRFLDVWFERLRDITALTLALLVVDFVVGAASGRTLVDRIAGTTVVCGREPMRRGFPAD